MEEGAAELDIRAEIQTRVDEIEQIIKRYLPAEEGYQKTIMEAMNYSILAGGKRLRPMLMSETYRLFGGKSKVIEPFMAAMEMIHTYSLVHDDLPAMDNDEYRRGKKTTHAVYGEAMGILAGDALLNYAFETAAKAFDMEPDNRNIGKAMQILATKAGIYGMVGGQVVDVQSEDSGDITKEKLDFIYRLKTGALIESSMLIGAVLAGATKNEQNTIGKAATEVGLAFQIQDDILDYTRTARTGKPSNNDLREHKVTLPLLTVLESVGEERRRELQARLARCHEEDESVEYLQHIVENEGGMEKAARVMQEYLARAMSVLSEYEPSEYRDALANLCVYVGERDR